MTQVEVAPKSATPPRTAAAVPHRHLHRHHHRHSAISLLGASVLTRLAFVAGISAVLWVAILWALA